ncbi:MAG: ATP12 family protein [Pseudomonadota bacterium]
MSGKSPFDAIFDGDNFDPMGAAQKHMRADLPKRFWSTVDLEQTDAGYLIQLDGRSARTPAKRRLLSLHRPVAEAMVAEWSNVKEVLDPAALPVTRLVNVAIDYAESAAEKITDDIVKYASSDLLCYRADQPEGLVRRQAQTWDPYLDWIAKTHNCALKVGAGIMPVEQSDQTLSAVRAAALKSAIDHEVRAALHLATSLTGSAVLGLSLFEKSFRAEDIWAAAHIDEDWNRELWGFDAEAEAARQAKKRDFDAAALVIAAARGNAANGHQRRTP